MAAMNSFVSFKNFIWLFVLGTVLSAPTDDFEVLSNDAELGITNEKYGMHIVPGVPINGYSSQKLKLSDIIDKENEHYKQFMIYVEKGHAMKGLTFNIYDDNMRDAAIALYRLLRGVKEDFLKIKEWAKHNINDDMFEYAWRLVSLFDGKFGAKETEPLFQFKPNYFVNSETIMKALLLKDGHFNRQEAKVNQYYHEDNVISINTNYSNWNSIDNHFDKKIDYFTEDISLNSYYYGVQLLHPYWMSNDELDEINPRHAEQYYFIHQQLMARYLLEKERFKYSLRDGSLRNDHKDYNPQLVYDNGLQFPVQPRVKVNNGWSENLVQISSTHTAIKECISRGIVFMENGTFIKMTEDNYVDLITKLIRANFDSIKTAKTIRSVYGSGLSGYSFDEYNPAPSLLHHAETSLRDPVYWDMIQYMLNHYDDYRNLLEPYDLNKYETEELCLLDFNATKITTFFNDYQFPLNNAIDRLNLMPHVIAARQRRLKHLPFSIDFVVESMKEKDVVVRLFLGPRCEAVKECWQNYAKFFQLDAYTLKLKSGTNLISWSSDQSTKLSFDERFNMADSSKQMEYNIFKFPENLLIPKGSKDGLNLTLFVMISPAEDSSANYEYNSNSAVYSRVSEEVDRKPLGFPFHRQATGYSDSACNYKFVNITVYHKIWPLDGSGYFSPHLY